MYTPKINKTKKDFFVFVSYINKDKDKKQNNQTKKKKKKKKKPDQTLLIYILSYKVWYLLLKTFNDGLDLIYNRKLFQILGPLKKIQFLASEVHILGKWKFENPHEL